MTNPAEFQHLLSKSTDAHRGSIDAWSPQSAGEKLAVAMVLNKPEWIASMGHTLAEAVSRFGMSSGPLHAWTSRYDIPYVKLTPEIFTRPRRPRSYESRPAATSSAKVMKLAASARLLTHSMPVYRCCRSPQGMPNFASVSAASCSKGHAIRSPAHSQKT